MRLFGTTKVNFMGQWKICLFLSASIIFAGIISLIIKGGPRYNIDFMGGTLVQLRYANPISISDIRVKMKAIGFGDAIIQEFGGLNDILIRVSAQKEAGTEEESVSDFIIRKLRPEKELQDAKLGKIDINNIEKEKLIESLTSIFNQVSKTPIKVDVEKIANDIIEKKTGLGGIFSDISQISSINNISKESFDKLKDKIFLSSFIVDRVEMVGPKVGKDLRSKAFFAIIASIIAMLIYIAFRFEFVFGLGAIIALIHDVLVTLGIFSIMNKEISLEVIAAFLTLVGFSVNDTIVIFDREKENLVKSKSKLNIMDFDSKSIFDIFNLSINQTLSRTVLTSGTVILTLLALFFLGGAVIHDFAFALLVGIITGTYSSVYVASTLAYGINYNGRKRKGLIETPVKTRQKTKKLVVEKNVKTETQKSVSESAPIIETKETEDSPKSDIQQTSATKRKTRGKSRAKDREKGKTKSKPKQNNV
jgi:preprotein translocase subunit SecF